MSSPRTIRPNPGFDAGILLLPPRCLGTVRGGVIALAASAVLSAFLPTPAVAAAVEPAPYSPAEPRQASAADVSAAQLSAAEEFDQLAKAYDAFRLTVYPEYALRRGVKDRAGELTDTSLAGVHKRRAGAATIL